jgi:hypothetical protein
MKFGNSPANVLYKRSLFVGLWQEMFVPRPNGKKAIQVKN